ncbi:MAG TPA: hypothetical protein VN258_01705 [Mobilitalea sp.]|nr:hypothetical protein [Mobilitalea sp.]
MLVLSLILTTCSSVPAFAAAKNIDTQLLKMGIPQELISIMPDEQKQYIVDSGVGVASCTKVEGTMEDSLDSSPSAEVAPMNLTQSDVGLWITVLNWTSTGGLYGGIDVLVNYSWNISPAWNLTDEIGLAWNGDKYLVDTYNYKRTSWTYDFYGNYYYTDTSYDLLLAAYNGCSWSIPMYQEVIPGRTAKNTGYCKIRLLNRTAHTTNTQEQVVATYLHKMIIPTVSLTISKPMAIGVSGTGVYETLSTYSNLFTY